MLVLKKEEINQENIVGNYYIIEKEDIYYIFEYVDSNCKYIIFKFIEECGKSPM